MSTQQQLPGTDPVLGSYKCGYGRSHQVPSEAVRVFRCGGGGFLAYCECGGHDLDRAADQPHRLGDHATLIGGTSLEPALWLALESVAEDGWDTTDGSEFGNDPYAERRAERKAECEREVTNHE